MKTPFDIKHIDHGFYLLTAPQAVALSIDGKLPEHGWQKKAKPAAELNKLARCLFYHWHSSFPQWQPARHPINDYVEGWIQRTPLSWFDGKKIDDPWVWAIHLYDVGVPYLVQRKLEQEQAVRNKKRLAEVYAL